MKKINMERCRRALSLIVFSFLVSTAGAQKFALVDMDYIFKNIPAYERANEQLNQVSKKWQAEVEALQVEAQTLYKNYQNEVVFLSQEQKKARQDAIVAKEKEAADLKKKYFGPEGELFKKRTALITPIHTEIYNAVKDIVADIRKYQFEHIGDNRKIILAVDDSGVMLNSIKNWLGDKYQVMLADSGLAAIKSITITRPDLIILDYEMPVVDGKQALAMIRSERDFADIPVIFLTGKQDRESIMGVMELKPDGYLLKTMKPYAVRQYIDEFFIKRNAQIKSGIASRR